jgi:small subunit ribosomal protein S19e
MAGLYDIDAAVFIEKAAVELKKSENIKAPEWATFVKTGSGRQRVPENADWWYTRTASILRKVYMRGPLGVKTLRMYYGNKKNRGVKPERFVMASGKIIRSILQQLEKEGLIEQVAKGVHKGRIVTAKGRSFADKVVKRETK